MASRAQVLSLYKSMMRVAQKFYSYNFRAYASRRIKDAFKENKSLTDKKEIKKAYDYGQDNLTILNRQIKMNSWFRTDKLVIEKLYNRLNKN